MEELHNLCEFLTCSRGELHLLDFLTEIGYGKVIMRSGIRFGANTVGIREELSCFQHRLNCLPVHLQEFRVSSVCLEEQVYVRNAQCRHDFSVNFEDTTLCLSLRH